MSLFRLIESKIIVAEKLFSQLSSKISDQPTWAKKLGFSIFILLSICFYIWPLLSSGQRTAYGDVDYQLQMYEAFRISTVHYHQFPWWNPWISGGVPLFANPQFGPLSVTALLTLVFGSALGVKFSFVIYLALGFWGMFKLTHGFFKASHVRAILLSYIWIFGGFWANRIIGGHFTFLLALLLPWLLYFYFTRRERRRWLQLSLLMSYMVWAAPHYATIMSFCLLAVVAVLDMANTLLRKEKKQNIMLYLRNLASFWLKVAGIVTVLGGPRLYYTLEYMHDFPRLAFGWPEPYFGVKNSLLSLFGWHQFGENAPKPPIWSWMEASYSIGSATIFALALILVAYGLTYKNKSRKKGVIFTYSPLILLILSVICYVLAQGRFFRYAPFVVLQHLPVFSSMRVAMRWMFGVGVGLLLILATTKTPRFDKVINALLLVSVLQLFLTAHHAFANKYTVLPEKVRVNAADFEQASFWRAHKGGVIGDENLYEATLNNVGQIRAGDSLVDNREPNTTVRCAASPSCTFVLTHNAKVVYWSPNYIKLIRTGSGTVELNMNPGKHWMVNGKAIFNSLRVTEPKQSFYIHDGSKMLNVYYDAR